MLRFIGGLSLFFGFCLQVSAGSVFIYGDDVLEVADDRLILDSNDNSLTGDIVFQFGEVLGEQLYWDDSEGTFVFTDDVNFQGNEIQDFRVERLAAEPAVCDVSQEARVYYNTVTSETYVCDGVVWRQIDNIVLPVTEAAKVAQTRNNFFSLFTDLNAGGVIQVPLSGLVDILDDAYVVNGNGIEVLQDGNYYFTSSIYVDSAAQRPNLDMRFYVNGVSQSVTGSTAYIRNQGGHNHSSVHLAQWLDLNANDVVTVRTQQEAVAGTVNLSSIGSSVLSAFLPATSAARGEKGEPGDTAFNWLSDNVDPGPADGIDGDLWLNTVSKDLFRKSGGMWSLEASLAVSSGYSVIWAEDSGSLTSGAFEWSYGNGDEDVDGGLVQMDGNIIGMSLRLPTAGATDTEVRILVNGVASGSVTAAGGSRNGFVEFAVPVAFNAGDVITFQTVTAGGATEGGAVSAMLQYN